jgi:hypothetical protein
LSWLPGATSSTSPLNIVEELKLLIRHARFVEIWRKEWWTSLSLAFTTLQFPTMGTGLVAAEFSPEIFDVSLRSPPEYH